VLGLFAAIARTATEVIVVLLLGARAEIYLFPAAKLVPNVIAGVLSGFITVFVLRLIARPIPSNLASASEARPRSTAPGEAFVQPNERDFDRQPPTEQHPLVEGDVAALSEHPSERAHERDHGFISENHGDRDRRQPL